MKWVEGISWYNLCRILQEIMLHGILVWVWNIFWYIFYRHFYSRVEHGTSSTTKGVMSALTYVSLVGLIGSL